MDEIVVEIHNFLDEIVGLLQLYKTFGMRLMATLMFLVMMRWKKIVIVTTTILLLIIVMIIIIQVMIIKRMARMMVLRIMMQLGDDDVFTPLPLALVLPSLPPPS